ncbi:MAG: hypothetical protein ACRDJH_21345 [Thermomicrobiales bacterium]
MTIERDVRLSDVAITLEPGDEAAPLQPLIHGLTLRLSSTALTKLAAQAVKLASARAPVEVHLTGCRLVDGGVEVSARAGKGFMGADVTAQLAITAAGDTVRVALANLDAPRWLPTASMIEMALGKASQISGIRPDPQNNQAVLVNPAEILVRKGLPARLAPGAWEVAIDPAALHLAYREQRE